MSRLRVQFYNLPLILIEDFLVVIFIIKFIILLLSFLSSQNLFTYIVLP